MNLPSLNFFGNAKKEIRQIAVIGLGRFGRAVCSSLHKTGYEVLGTDVDEHRVSQALIDRIAAHAIQLDSTNPNALREAGVFEFEVVVVAIGNYLQESIVTTLNLKEAGVKYVVAKASSEVHGKLLQKVGADRVVFPEHEAGCALAQSLTKPSIVDRFTLDSENSIVELIVPEAFDGKTIVELELRNRYGVNILAIGNGDKFEINPPPQQRLTKGKIVVVLGSNKNIDTVANLT
jgi:trk system potassium uptake protein TrkA